MKVVIDSREQGRIDTATKYYTEQGLNVEVAELQIGDYVFNDKVVFEFKLVSDFVASIQDGRVFNQSIEMAENYDYSFVIIHGDEATRAKCLAMSRNYRPVTVYQYVGAIASLNRYTTVIESYTPFIQEAYYRMYIQAKKCLQNKPIVKKFPKKHKNAAFNYLCYCIYGLNSKRATEIVNTYHLKSLHDLQQLTTTDLKQIDGIGDKIANNIINSIQGENP